MEKKYICLFLFSAILIISSCTNTGSGPSSTNYRTGTQGITLSLISIPSKLYENSRGTPITVEVKNQGAFPQYDEHSKFDGVLWIGGYDDDLLRITPSNGIDLDAEELEGKSQYNNEGGRSLLSFDVDVKKLPSGTTVYKPILLFTATYRYQTIASPMVCIDPDPQSMEVREKVCTTHDVSAGSQGAPIVVSNIEQDVAGDTIIFKIRIRNTGNGILIPESDWNQDPDEGYDIRDLDEVKIRDVRVGNTRMSSCMPSIGKALKLTNNEGYIQCRLDKSRIGSNVYTSPLNIELTYGYTTSISTAIEVIEDIG